MTDRPDLNPWDAELQKQILEEEYARRGETYPGTIAEHSPTEEPEPARPAQIAARDTDRLPESEQERLARQFEAEFRKQAENKPDLMQRMVTWSATKDGRVALIALATVIGLLLVYWWLSNIAAHTAPPRP